jgi:acyl transferase domain-containing protein/acyl carrier protein
MTSTSTSKGAIAVVGMAGRFPGARNIDEFWRNLREGVESLVHFSDEELAAAGVSRELLANPAYVKSGSPLDRACDFDAAFFGINPREAEVMDPQQRLFLECAWEAIEDAGYDVDRLPGPVGVFAGSSMNTYANAHLLANPAAVASVGPYQAMIGNDKDYLSTRVSYKLNLRGPGVTVQTACSTSLVAVHMACQSLLQGECDMALAGGVSVMFPQRTGYLYQDGMIFSPDAKVRPFDAKGKGIRAGEGVGIVVLKRLEDALAAGDSIRAVILGTAINNDGDNKIGFTAPSIDGQAEAIIAAQSRAGIDPGTIGYVEAHGTATPVGDPIEIAALTKAFRTRTQATGYCAIGSVKSNVGHLDAAAGVTGLIKAILSLQHGEIPPSLNFEEPNPQIDFANSPFFVNSALRKWSKSDIPRRAGVSSFGIGGTNAHAVLEEAPPREVRKPTADPQVLVLSARSAAALDSMAERLAKHLESNPNVDLGDVAYTLQVGRRVFEHRYALVAHDVQAAQAALASKERRRSAYVHCDAHDRDVVFMFSGQGSQYAQMGAQLYRSERVFRENFDVCADGFKRLLNVDLRELLFGDAAAASAAAEKLAETWLTQPALFAVEYALAQQWLSWGVTPKAMIGHSIGEYVAACIAGVFDLHTALELVAKRGELMQACVPGAMLSVPLAAAELRSYLPEDVEIAAINAPELCVAAGPIGAIESLELELERAGVLARRLRTSHAFHSASMQSAADQLIEYLRDRKLSAPTIPFVSNVSGGWITPEQATDPAYWGQHLRSTVRFADGVQTLVREIAPLFLEVGPGETLKLLARQSAPQLPQNHFFNSLPHPAKRQPELDFLLGALAHAWAVGAMIEWRSLHADRPARRVPLPTYPFESRRFCIERAPATLLASPVNLSQQRQPLESWGWLPSWQRSRPLAPRTQKLSGRWLVFVNETSTCAAIVAELQRRGLDVVTATPAHAYAVTGSDEYELVPDRREDYDRLLRDVLKAGQLDCILHLWSARADASGTDVQLGRTHGFYSLLYLAQALGDVERSSTLPVLVATTDQHRVIGDECVQLEQSLLAGPILVMSQDIPYVRGRGMDFTRTDWTAENAKKIASAAIGEALDDTHENLVAYRGGYRWTQTMSPIELQPTDEHPLLREGGVYFITGGTGGIGLALARNLAATLKAKLVLTSRAGLPPRDEWNSLLESEGTAPALKKRIGDVLALEKLGAEVLVVAADAADEAQMKLALEQANARFGKINGVIHAAGLPGIGILPMKQPAQVEAVLRPKVEGLLILDELLAGADLDFLMLCSSVNSAFGWSGTTDYTSANAFLDAFAQSGTARSTTRVLALNWGTWREVGMAADLAAARGDDDSENMRLAISPEEGAEVFRRALSSDYPQIFISPRPMPQVMAESALLLQHMRAAHSGEALPEANRPASIHERPNLNVDYAAPRSDDERALASVWSDLLGIQPIGIHDNFFELGGHSLLATRVLARVQSTFKVRLPMRALFDAPTVAQLVELVHAAQWTTSGQAEPNAASNENEMREEIEL